MKFNIIYNNLKPPQEVKVDYFASERLWRVTTGGLASLSGLGAVQEAPTLGEAIERMGVRLRNIDQEQSKEQQNASR